MKKLSFLVLLLFVLIGCNGRSQEITKEQFDSYVKKHEYVVSGGTKTTNVQVLNLLKGRDKIVSCIKSQMNWDNIDVDQYSRLRNLIQAAFPNTSARDINLLTSMIYLHGPVVLLDASIVDEDVHIPYFMNTKYGNPISTLCGMLIYNFDPYCEAWNMAKKLNIPNDKLYFNKLSNGHYELVVPNE
jgi:hypothetical protein